MTASTADRSPITYADEPAFWRRVAWPQVAVLCGIGLATLGPIALALLLAI